MRRTPVGSDENVHVFDGPEKTSRTRHPHRQACKRQLAGRARQYTLDLQKSFAFRRQFE
jgi:hypothetical protein